MLKFDCMTYEQRGVSPEKLDVKKALVGMSQGLFPGAFCKAIPDVLSGSQDHCILLHADGAGTKSALAYIHYSRHRNPNIFRGIAQDSLVMNLDDLLCVGATGPYVLSNTIGRNAKLIPGEVIENIIWGYEDFIESLHPYGIEIYSCGGETADLGDIVRTLIVDSTLSVRMRREEFINCNLVKPGSDIVGFASFGQSTYESKINSGIGTNGFTTARHEILTNNYREKYPETFAPEILDSAYSGKWDIDDNLPGTSMTVGEALLSPTRTYAPILFPILREHRKQISAIFHNSGGGQTKCLNFGSNIRYVKENLFEMPPIFSFMQETAGLPIREMLRVFNMGHRLEIVCEPDVTANLIKIANKHSIEARVIGRVEHCSSKCSMIIVYGGQSFEFNAA